MYILADIALLVFSIFGLKALNEYYVPWEAKSKDGDNVNVRDGPDKDYKAIRLLKGTEIVAIVDEVYDWYVLSIDPLEMVRQSTMKAIPKDDSQRRTEIYQYMLQYPPWHLIAIGVLWFWPSTRTLAPKACAQAL